MAKAFFTGVAIGAREGIIAVHKATLAGDALFEAERKLCTRKALGAEVADAAALDAIAETSTCAETRTCAAICARLAGAA